MKKGLRGLLIVLAVLLALLLGAAGGYLLWERAPVRVPSAPVMADASGEEAESAPAEEEPRSDGVYTVLLVGNDDGNGNTDTLIVLRLDSVGHRVEAVSIPRDTLINVPWDCRKINAVYWADRNNGGDGIGALKRHIGKLCGFVPDCYAVLDLDVFVRAVDAMGGVRFDVPFAMDYEDPSQQLFIHLEPGEQLLNGYQAMCLCRYRSGYANGDLGRIEMQQRFLKSLALQMISLGGIPNLPRVVEILSGGLETDLDSANIAWFLRQALRCKGEDINFYTAPTEADGIAGYSYAILELRPWLELINTHLNPGEAPITERDLDIVCRDNGRLSCTGTMRDPDYYTRAGG